MTSSEVVKTLVNLTPSSASQDYTHLNDRIYLLISKLIPILAKVAKLADLMKFHEMRRVAGYYKGTNLVKW